MTADARARFVLAFMLLLVVELGAVVWVFGQRLDGAVNRATARTSAAALNLVGAQCQADDDYVVCPSLSNVRIIFECTAVFPVGVFLAAVIAFPASWKRKLVGLGLGVPTILLVNVGRVMSLVWLTARFPSATEWVHVVLWQTLMIVLVVGIWLLWAGRAARQGRARIA